MRTITGTIATQQPTTTTEACSQTLAENEATKVKAQITKIWDAKLERRKDAYWNYVKNKGHNDMYSKWLNSDQIVIPQYLQKKQFNNEHPDQRKLREAAVLHDFKTETDLRGLRASQQQEKAQRIDGEMETLFQDRCSGNAAKILSQMWKAQVSQNEKISHKRWLKNEKWLTNYEENFKNSHVTSNPYFKLENREQATYAQVAAKPKKKTPTSREGTTTPTPQQTKQISLETIQTLLQQIQTEKTKEAPRPQRKQTRRTRWQPSRQQTSRDDAIFVQSDNDDDFLEESTSTETLK
ncbi:MAG: hypothetical protein N0E48_20490 [Candidatus Thiodiazotropha endolucinida]|nr:hypothetical protein [Candidatus Thiodiazotropha taylori]MCW4345712.1 hypothetical protein [Candidatus Thiodiazotropha endolucinida]